MKNALNLQELALDVANALKAQMFYINKIPHAHVCVIDPDGHPKFLDLILDSDTLVRKSFEFVRQFANEKKAIATVLVVDSRIKEITPKNLDPEWRDAIAIIAEKECGEKHFLWLEYTRAEDGKFTRIIIKNDSDQMNKSMFSNMTVYPDRNHVSH